MIEFLKYMSSTTSVFDPSLPLAPRLAHSLSPAATANSLFAWLNPTEIVNYEASAFVATGN
jgi:hypothetical protein